MTRDFTPDLSNLPKPTLLDKGGPGAHNKGAEITLCPNNCGYAPKLFASVRETNLKQHLQTCPKRVNGHPTPAELHDGLDAKLSVFDDYADAAVDYIIDWFTNHRDELVALARGRHVEGHYRYGNRNFLEWSSEEILAQAAQEGADKIVYVSRVLYRNATGNQ